MSGKIQKMDMRIKVNRDFLDKAEELKPVLFEKSRRPFHLVKVEKNEGVLHGAAVTSRAPYHEAAMEGLKQGDVRILDFGGHSTGYVRFRIRTMGSPQDAPVKLRLVFGEMLAEVLYPFSDYQGWLSSSWLQEELLFLDETPVEISLPRRYSFRYLKLEILGISDKYTVSVGDIFCRCVTSADVRKIPELCADPDLQKIDETGIRTLQECMQDVFEDGPKRDRRLWLGDLRLQALVCYETVKNYDLVKRCLYLFAGAVREDGLISSCIFTRPEIIPDDTFLFEYSLFFVAALYEYYEASGDKETLKELWESAYRQIELAQKRLNRNGIVMDDSSWWSFIDWNDDLNKQASAQGTFLYCLERGIRIAGILGDKRQEELQELLIFMKKGARDGFWEPERGYFVSGPSRQISWASQVWMVLGEVTDLKEGEQLLLRLERDNPEIRMVTPFMYHYYIEALIKTGQKKKAEEKLKEFWGGMIRQGADTFWEVYDPDNPNFSPYGNYLITSYCHAWSCTPSYFIRKYFV